MGMKVFGFNGRILMQRRKDAEKILRQRNGCVLNQWLVRHEPHSDLPLVTLLHSL